MKKKILVLFFYILSASAYSQIGTEFWFACPDLSSKHFESCIRLCLITFDQAATVTISQPANNNFTAITKEIEANSYSVVELGNLLSKVETASGAIRNTGLLIQSTADISAYYTNYCDNSEIYALKGKNALGTDFIVPTQFSYPNSETYGGSSAIEIVASQDSTDVTITPTQACVGYSKGQTFTIRLNRGQTFALKAKGMTALSHLFNTRILSNKPIAVNYTDDSVEGPGVDLIGDQLIPCSLAGSHYIAIKYAGNVEEVYIFPTADSTNVYLNGTLATTMNLGGKFKQVLTTGATVIASDNPVIVLQITSNGDELGAAILPSITCTGSNEVAYKYVKASGATISLVTKTENIDAFTLNGVNYLLPKSYFRPVPSDSTWSYAFKAIDVAANTPIRIKNSKGIFHLGVLDNPGTTCSFGYFSNFNSIPLGVSSDMQYYLEGDNLQLSIKNPENFTNIQWSGPNGFTSTEINPLINNVTETDAGAYIVNATHIEGCETPPDTIRVSIYKPRTYQVSVCYGNSDYLTAEGFGPYSWTPEELPAEKTVSINTTKNGTYTAKSYKLGVNRIHNNEFQASNCQSNETIWSETIDNITLDARNAISAVFTSEEGKTAPTLQYFINGKKVGNPIIPTTDGTVGEYIWPSISKKATISIATTDDSSLGSNVKVNNISFAPVYAITDSFIVTVRDSLIPVIFGDNYICKGEANISVEGEYDTYQWSNGSNSKAIVVTEPGTYSVKVTKADCKGSGTYNIKTAAEMTLTLDSLPTICHGDPIFNVNYTLLSGALKSYNILFNDHAKQVGFDDMLEQLPNGNNFDINIPANTPPDIYKANLSFYEPICGEMVNLPLNIQVRYSSDSLITQRWNDVISVRNENYNGGYTFSAYQWYKNGHIMDGETNSYIYKQNGEFSPSDSYCVLLTRNDSVQIFTCEYNPMDLPEADKAIILGQTIVMPLQNMQLYNIPTNGTATLWNITGQPITTTKINMGMNTIKAPAKTGVYILHISTKEEHKQFRIVVQ